MTIAPVLSSSQSQQSQDLTEGWQFALLAPGQATSTADLADALPSWMDATVPGTAMADLFSSGKATFDQHPSLDEMDVWYRCRFKAEALEPCQQTRLVLEGLATIAEVWLNGSRLLESHNMFQRHVVDVSERLQTDNELLIRFASLNQALQTRRPRPRWRTKLVQQQQLRWWRTSLIGRIPGWTPAVPAVGPWRPVRIVRQTQSCIEELDARAVLDAKGGTVNLQCTVRSSSQRRPASARLRVGDWVQELSVMPSGDKAWRIDGEMHCPQARPWWPHSHGEPQLYPVSLELTSEHGSECFDLGKTGFRSLRLAHEGDDFFIEVNGTRVFCRGACWTTTDVLRLTGSEASTREALLLARDAGMNMLRISGTMFYEADHFYALCDELGILLWQDWMFANMDYPADDDAFVATVSEEGRQFLLRCQLSPCLAVLCGNSEVEQQAAMLGLDQSQWRSRLFSDVLPSLGAQWRPDVPYWPSSPAGGVLPFQVDSGAAHYFGVGAYLQPLTDARRCGVRFTSECLAFANVPENETIETLLSEGQSPFHHPRWKARVPRDSGTGWDFDDVRDHYLAELFKLDPMRLRYADMDRYLALSRVVTGEVMAATFAEWRRKGSSCSGGLVWFLRDLWPGAGWGVVDSLGTPKAPWYYLRRAFAPVALFMTNEGVNGIALHAINERAAEIKASLTLTLYRHGEHRVAQASQGMVVPARGAVELRADAVLGHFLDTTYSYRFAPPGHDLVHAVLREEAGNTVLGEDFLFPLGHSFPVRATLDVDVQTTSAADGSYSVCLQARRFAQALSIDAPGFRISDNYFHLCPGQTRTLVLRPSGKTTRLQASLGAINAAQRLRLSASPSP